MAAVVVVHGIGQQYRAAELLHEPVARALRGGVQHAGHQAPGIDRIAMAFYGDLFRREGRRGGPEYLEHDGSDLSRFEEELALRWWRAAARIDPENVQNPDTAGARAPIPLTVKAALRALSRSRFATTMTEPALYGSLRQLRHYLDGDMREPVLARVSGLITEDTRVVVGHSLGSVVAYEALCALPGHGVRALITLGSPLGVRHLVFERLCPAPREGRGAWPGAGVRWTNIYDRRDVVALRERLSGLFGADGDAVADAPVTDDAPEVLDRAVDNGWRAHDLLHYLTDRATGAAIHEGLTR
ncbi:hypothetical protein SLINC_5952 [Streptomyces lincolnensis]|uniref:Uncharacterized protein n=1 Tax=Streptomyces lincolnensis TaxID=1915 RepID=A0A1B1MHR7_STRLN|nr:hypothetical protein [Streptomyces lincolnensis]ANS68176.1 hypothetical protein SLINC_5952 [Streptomyces lincolnensis]AXG53617.1 hypothetical protein SLCG_2462 [Streptomyces lincolnensis]QMV09824.1 hypothetical protein GJU35_31990 [Streptomyces lincolnensis]